MFLKSEAPKAKATKALYSSNSSIVSALNRKSECGTEGPYSTINMTSGYPSPSHFAHKTFQKKLGLSTQHSALCMTFVLLYLHIDGLSRLEKL